MFIRSSKSYVNVVFDGKRILAMIILCFIGNFSWAQDKITLKDAKEISYQANERIDELQQLLNYISFNDNVPSELADAISNSFKPSKNRIFSNKDIIIESDLDPKSKLNDSKDVPVEKYMNDLDLKYVKTADPSITLSKYYVSNVKKKDYLYIKVRFDSDFGSKYATDSSSYTTRQREAILRVDSLGNNKWQVLIDGISFYNPADSIETNTKNDVQIITDTSATASVVSQEEFSREVNIFVKAQQEKEKEKQAIFNGYITVGNNYVSNKQYKEAIEIYMKAKDLKPLVPSLDKQIIDAQKLMADYTYENYKNKGDKAKSERNFEDAIQLYNQAIALNPAAGATLQTEIQALSEIISTIALPKNKLQSGDFQGAIDECEKILHEHKKDKFNYPEIFYIEAQGYQLKAEQNRDDKHDLDKALEDYSFAIQYFTNYKDARIARAGFFVKYRKDFVGAITDYDVLTTNEMDTSPDKPLYFVAKAKLKDMEANFAGAQIDYDVAIKLSPTTASIYYNKGELLYRLKNNNDAVKYFATAVKLDPKYTLAYYYQGLNYLSLNNPYLSGISFASAEKLGLDSLKIGVVDSISNNFFLKGKMLSDKHDFSNADSAYDDALKIRNCNANALHGKAEIRLITGDEQRLAKNNAAAAVSYGESIKLNRQAITCSPAFSDVHFKEGLAHLRIGEFDLAINSFTNAIKSESNNVQAYIERGNTFQIQEKYAKAVDDYNQAIVILQANLEAAKKGSDKLRVNNIVGDLSKSNQLNGQAQYYLADYINAILSLNKSIDWVETNNEAFYYRGLVYFAKNELSKSTKDLGEAIKIKPQYKYYYQNGRVNFKNRSYPAAINNFSEAINTDSLNELKDKFYLRGLSYFKSKQYNEAIRDFDTYNKETGVKTDTAFYADYGLAQLFVNQDTSAVKSFQYVLTISPNNARALFGMGCSYAKKGQFDMVFDLMQKAFTTRVLSKDEIKPEEEAFLADFNKVKANRSKYNELKKTYLNSN